MDCSPPGSSVHGILTGHHLSKPTGCTTPRVSPYVHCSFWVIMMSQHRFTDFNKCPTLMRYIDGIGGCACVRPTFYYILLSLKVYLMRWSSDAGWRLGKTWWLFSSSQLMSFLNHKPGFSLEIRMSSLRKSKYQTWFNGFCVLQITEGKGAQSFYTCVTLDICPFLPVLQMHLLNEDYGKGIQSHIGAQFSSNIERN